MSPSPEKAQLAVTDLSTTIAGVLDAQEATVQALEDGSRVRKVEVRPYFGPTLTETTTPDGIKHYEMTRPFRQSDDSGTFTHRWQEGGDTVTSISKMEIAGDRTKIYTDEAAIKGVQHNVEHVASQLPEKSAQRKGRLGKLLGKLATRY